MSDNELDELVEGFEGDAGDLSDEEISKREEAFNKRVKKNIAILMSPKKFDTSKRIAAAHWLGELGEPTAIPYLVKIYKGDKSAGMKPAAAEALSMLKALGETLEDPDPEIQEFGMELVQNIVIKGEYGKRLSPPVKTLRRLQLGLMLLAFVVFGVAIFIPEKEVLLTLSEQMALTQAVTTPSMTPTSSDPKVLLSQFRDLYTALDNDARVLKAQMFTITQEQPADCTLTFSTASTYTLPDLLTGVPQINEVMTGYNSAVTIIEPIRARFLDSCATNQPLARADALDLGSKLVDGLKQLDSIAPLLASIGVDVPPTPTAIAIATSTPTPTETPTPTATVDPSIVNGQFISMENIINEMNGVRGANTLLLSYWQDAQGGSRGGCLQLPPPLIPGDVVVSVDLLKVAPDLQDAATTLNTALAITRNSWLAFESGCNTNTLDTLVTSQIPAVQAAQTGYNQTKAKLDAISASLGR